MARSRNKAFHTILASMLVLAACEHEKDGAGLGTTTPVEKKLEKAAPAIPAKASKHMIVAGHPLAAEAGRDILRKGGSALDAVIAAEMVLSLVEPQSSGIGGGAFLMHYGAKSGAIDAYDGRETAPKSASAYMFLDGTGKPRGRREAGTGGLGVGVPGLLRMLERAHKDHGKLLWAELFQPAIKLAEDGFAISKRLAFLMRTAKDLTISPVTKAYFFDANGKPKKAGTILKNPALAETLKTVADRGADAFYNGPIAKAIAKAVGSSPKNPVRMIASDFATYRAKKRPPVCISYRQWLICGMGPPSSGGITTLQIMGILQKFDMAKLKPGSVQAIHLIGEAGAIAFADRNVYIADPDFVPVPSAGLLYPKYLSLRASEISLKKAGGKRQPGLPASSTSLNKLSDDAGEGFSTTHLSVIDKDGNAVAMTASNAWTFGSRLMAAGFILNNQLTDFSFTPNRSGAPVINRAAPGKRPRSSMAPILVFDANGKVVLSIGSPGGSRIIGYVAKAIIAVLDWKMNVQDAVNFPNFLSRNKGLEIEKNTPLAKLKPDLELLGHQVKLFSFPSGLNGITVTKDGLEGGADKRREGIAFGD
ncbi:MAG: gamma-glutamyltransferase [Rhodospirillales bacterium]